jgi:plasmid stabilization system protein ParE
MSHHLEIGRQARRDVYRILRWLEHRSPRGAAARYAAFWRKAVKIAQNPESFAAAEESVQLGADIRAALFKTRQGRRYRIVFRFDSLEVRILRIRRPGRRPLQRRDLRDD